MTESERDQVAAAIRVAFDCYETALMENDVDTLVGLFWQDARTIRLVAGGGAYGINEIADFRNARDVSDIARELLRVEIVVLSPDIGVATAEYRRLGSGRYGAQSQVWMLTADGWRIASAHVSLSAQ